jgi:heterodisulfide reductase subunit A
MEERDSTGVILSDSSLEFSKAIDYSAVENYAKGIPGVIETWHATSLSLSNPDTFASKIRDRQVKRIVIAGHRPGLLKSYVARAMASAGVNPGNIVLADFKEHGVVSGKETDRAKGILLCAALNIPFEAAAQPEEVPVHQDTLVIGGGIAGIQASLEIANGKKKVYLLEQTGTIGGHMAMFDKTFPTLDCAACILTPKMVEVGQHPNIELMTYCQVKEVSGSPGNYKVRILKKARRVDLAKCIGCGVCSEKCPGQAPSEFDSGTTMRKAIYIPFPQAVPNKYLVDEENCLYCQSGKCGVCVKICPAKCIDLDEQDQVVEIEVGNIVLATGFKTFDPKRAEQYGYGKFPNVVTSLEFERLVNASGPTGGNIKSRTKDKKGNWIFSGEGDEPKSVALIHCIGSRDVNHNAHCSRVCCMYSLKLAHLVREKLPDAEIYEYYIDMRAFGKGYEEFYDRIRGENIRMIRGRTAKIERQNGKLLLRSEDIAGDSLMEQPIDMAILAVGLEPREDAEEMSSMLGIALGDDGWFKEAGENSDPISTMAGGITIAGVCQGPKDIPDTVAQASAAASRVLQSIANGKIGAGMATVPLSRIEARVKELSGN